MTSATRRRRTDGEGLNRRRRWTDAGNEGRRSRTAPIQPMRGGVGGDDAVPVSKSALVLTAVLAAISYLTLPETLHLPPGTRPTLLHVWYYGWISALSTGLGVLPLVFAPELDTFWIGVSNGEFL